MAGNQSNDDQGSAARRGAARAPPLGGRLRRWRQRWSAKPHERGPFYVAAAGAALTLWLASGFYQVDDGERGVLQRFGAYAGLRASGPGWHLPWPIETMTSVNLDRNSSVDFQSHMLTADEVLLNVTASIHYQYIDARAALFAVRDSDAVVRSLGEAAARELVGQRRVAELLGGAARTPLMIAIRSALQKPLDVLGAGVRVLEVDLTDVQVPEAVLPAQRDLVQAGEERDKMAREAQGYAAEVLPAAQGTAQRQRLDAESYKLQTIGVAEGDAARFDQLVVAYARAPEVTRTRMYIETVETILARSRKLIIDGKGGNTLVLPPLDRLGDAGAQRASGAVGVASAGAGAAAGAGATAARPEAGPQDERGRDRGERR
jgi:membrane protease subunit HflK